MRKTGSGIALVVGLVSGVASAAPAFRWTGSGTSAAFHYDVVSSDGCTETVGDVLLVSNASVGTQGITIGETIDFCNLTDGMPTESFFVGGGEVSYSQTGLASATGSGSFTVWYYSGIATGNPTVAFDVSLNGSGNVSTSAVHWISTAGGTTLSFNAQRQRHATVAGTMTFDGESATVSDGQLFTETAGELVVLNK
jgi:hypothetical protein